MAPRAGGRRTATASPQAYREFGREGRQTGITLPDRGERDEYGMQPIDSIFSSPRKQQSSSARSNRTRDDSGSDDMDIASSAGPGPRTLLKNREIQYPIPRSRSPLKTNLKSPARHNPHVDRMSSPERPSPVNRKSVFPSKTNKLQQAQPAPAGRSNGLNGRFHVEDDEDVDDDEDVQVGEHPTTDDIIDQSIRMIEDMGGDSEEEPPLVDDEPLVEDPPTEEDEPQLPPAKKPGRPSKKEAKLQALEKARATKKRRSLQDEPDEAADQPDNDGRSKAKKQKTTAGPSKAAKGKAPAAAKPGPKPGRPKGRPRKVQDTGDDAEVGDTSIAALQRGPPMPKARGLVSVRHEESMKQTRSGRHSYRPLAFWRGEAAVAEREDYDDMFGKDRHFVLPSIKEVVRVAPDVAPSKRAPRSKSRAKTKSKTAQAQEEDEELEEWETSPGTVAGEVVIWEPEHELHPPAEDEPVHIAEEQIAISGDAVQTRDIRDATFRFAKTLTMPFMGAGIVDLPPGAEKRPKNSRKMHMVFFVHYGKVMVTVNEAQFRISPGGTWFVPRGNYYSITNDYDNPARVFFAQACEVPAQPVNLGEE